MDVTEVAKIVRRALKEAFPTVKFGIKSHRYAGGTSIDVSWTDGPSTSDVDKLTRVFEGKRFRGIDDSTYYVTHVHEGETVRFGSDYVQSHRSLTPEFRAKAKALLVEMKDQRPEAFAAFLNSVHHRGDVDRDLDYLTHAFAMRHSEIEPKGSVTVTAILLANPFLHEER